MIGWQNAVAVKPQLMFNNSAQGSHLESMVMVQRNLKKYKTIGESPKKRPICMLFISV